MISYIIANLIELLLCASVFHMHYETNDDIIISNIIAGLYGQQDYHVEGISGFLCMVTEGLYKLIPSINWHTVILLFCAFTSLNIIIYIFIKLKPVLQKAYPFAICFIYLLAFCYYAVLQFTRVSALCFTASFLLLIYTYEYVSDKKELIRNYIVAALVAILASMIRFEMLLTMGLIFTPIFLIKLIGGLVNADKRSKTFKLIGIIAVTGIICLAHRYLDRNLYSEGDYHDWKVFFAERIELMDHGWPECEENRELYESLGISENSFTNYILWDLDDPDYITIDSMDTLIKAKPYSVYYSKNIFEADWGKVIHDWIFLILLRLYKHSIFYLAIASLMLLGIFGTREKNTVILSYGALLLSELILAYMQRGLRARVDVGMFTAIILITFYGMYDGARKEISVNARRILLTGCAIFIAVFAFGSTRGQLQRVNYERGIAGKQELLHLCASDTNSVYICPELDYLPIEFNVFKAYPEGYMSNVISMGGWMTASPMREYQKSVNGIENVYRDLVDAQNVYLIIMDTDKDIKVQYLREHYGDDINAIRVKSINGAGIYRIVRGDEIPVPDIDVLKAAKSPEVNYEIFDNEEGIRTIMGTAVVTGDDSFTQKVYVGVPDVNGDIQYHSTVQLVTENNDDRYNGKYATFYYECSDKDSVDESTEIQVVYEN